jgi:hypothetical protein
MNTLWSLEGPPIFGERLPRPSCRYLSRTGVETVRPGPAKLRVVELSFKLAHLFPWHPRRSGHDVVFPDGFLEMRITASWPPLLGDVRLHA